MRLNMYLFFFLCVFVLNVPASVSPKYGGVRQALTGLSVKEPIRAIISMTPAAALSPKAHTEQQIKCTFTFVIPVVPECFNTLFSTTTDTTEIFMFTFLSFKIIFISSMYM